MNKDTLLIEILDNTATRENYKELGLFKFAKRFFPKRFKGEFSTLHYDMAMLLFKLLDPAREYAVERQAYFLVHRQAAKSTFGSFLFPIFLIYLKGLSIFITRGQLGYEDNPNEIVEITIDEDYIMITSETTFRAERFVTSIKDEIASRTDLNTLFGEKDPRVIEIDEAARKKSAKVWRLNAFVTADNTVVHGIGSGQRVRGANEGGSRPTLIIVDDMYSLYNTKTTETRQKVSYWFNAELSNSLDAHKGGKGKILWLGTMVHQDTVITDFKKSNSWFGLERPIISNEELMDAVDLCTVNNEFKMPTKYECTKLQTKYNSLSWPTSADLYFILSQYADAYEKKQLNWFYQEYMNMPIDPSSKMIERDAFYETAIKSYKQDNRQYVEFTYQGITWVGQAVLYLGLDPAASISNSADDTAIVVAGIARCYPRVKGYDHESSEAGMPLGKLFPIVLHVEGGKYAIHDYENMPGMCEALLRLDKQYKLDMIKIEANGQQVQIIREIRQAFKDNLRLTRIWEEFSSMQKDERIRSIIYALAQQTKVIVFQLNTKIDLIYHQTLMCGMTDHDDYADACAIAFKDCKVPDIRSDMLYKTLTVEEDSRYDALIEKYGDEAWQYV